MARKRGRPRVRIPSQKRKLTAADLAAAAAKPACSVEEFCALHSISRPSFNNYVRDGIGPTLMRIQGRVLISREAAEAWRRQIEAHPLPKRGRPRRGAEVAA